MSPDLLARLRRFRDQRRAWVSLWILGVLFVLSLFSELLSNSRPLVMRFEGKTYFPIVHYYPARIFGDEVRAEVDYRALRHTPRFEREGNWMIFPPLPYSPSESMARLATPPPTPPSPDNPLGTDDRGRDLLARLIYGFRSSMLFALGSWVFILALAFLFGATQGYLGGWWDFLGQRLIEIWHAVPLLYVVIFLVSVFPPSLKLLTAVWVAFNWVPLSTYIRAETLRVRQTDYIAAAKVLGASTPRILAKHVLPNSLTPILTFSPFLIATAVSSLAALDYLGLGLPPPTASWGELLHQGKENLHCWWLSLFPFLCLFATLCLLSFIGEGVRQAFETRRAR